MAAAITPEGVSEGGCSYSVVTVGNVSTAENTEITINKATTVVTSTFAVSERSAECQAMAYFLGFDPDYGDNFDFNLNLASFSTAVAVNYGILTAATLTEIKDDPYTGYQYDDDSTATYGNIYGTTYGNLYGYAPGDDVVVETTSVESRSKRAKGTKQSILEANRRMLENNNGNDNRVVEADSWTEFEVAASTSGVPGKFRRFYDYKYDGMSPVACIIFDKNTSRSVCFVLYELSTGTVYAYPVMKHFEGTNCSDATKWGPDWYNSDPTLNGEWVSTPDHTVDIFLGLIVFETADAAIDFAKEVWGYLSQPGGNGDLVIPDRVYPSMNALYYGEGDNYDTKAVCGVNATDGQTRKCFMWLFNLYGPNFYITSNNYQLFAGACRNSLYVSQAFQGEGAIKNSPEDLIETFFECVLKPYDAAFNAVGLSLGNADLYSRYFFFVVMGVLVGSMVYFGGFETGLGEFTSKEEEEEKEKLAKEQQPSDGIFLSKKTGRSDDDNGL